MQRNEKTWANFQVNFKAAQQKHKRKQKVSTRAGGYHGANNLREIYGTHDALINLSTAAVADRETMMSQCKTTSDLIVTDSALNQKLQKENAVHNRGSVIPVDIKEQANPNWVNGKHVHVFGGYFWTHGHCVDTNHDSRMCRSKKEGHMENATRADNMGKNQYGKPRA